LEAKADAKSGYSERAEARLVRLPEIFYLPSKPRESVGRKALEALLQAFRSLFRASPAAGDLCLRKKEGDPFCIRRPSGVMREA